MQKCAFKRKVMSLNERWVEIQRLSLSKDAFRFLFWDFAPETPAKVGKETGIEYIHKGSNFELLTVEIEIQNKKLK